MSTCSTRTPVSLPADSDTRACSLRGLRTPTPGGSRPANEKRKHGKPSRTNLGAGLGGGKVRIHACVDIASEALEWVVSQASLPRQTRRHQWAKRSSVLEAPSGAVEEACTAARERGRGRAFYWNVISSEERRADGGQDKEHPPAHQRAKPSQREPQLALDRAEGRRREQARRPDERNRLHENSLPQWTPQAWERVQAQKKPTHPS